MEGQAVSRGVIGLGPRAREVFNERRPWEPRQAVVGRNPPFAGAVLKSSLILGDAEIEARRRNVGSDCDETLTVEAMYRPLPTKDADHDQFAGRVFEDAVEILRMVTIGF